MYLGAGPSSDFELKSEGNYDPNELWNVKSEGFDGGVFPIFTSLTGWYNSDTKDIQGFNFNGDSDI